MRFEEDRPFSDPEVAARKLLEIANSVEAVRDGRIHIEKINYRLRVERIALKVRLMTRGGYDWTRRYPPASRMPDGFNTEVDKTGWRH
jgi:hypothetical protein